MIQSLLIANRGEIACRIIRTARAMGIRTVAVYSDADAKALHVRQADEAVHIGPSPASESYLVGEMIIAAAKETGAEAIHPGYGFLSENADFAQAVIDAGLVWVGPSPESIRAMGLKDAAKKLMEAAGVPVTPGYMGEDQSETRLAAEADAIGYPVLIKAVAGGGGKGMRKVERVEDFAAALESAKREAEAAFGNDHVLLEKWINSPRHIEVQVFGDTHGNVVHLFERDCSLQRRHQKVIEEAPAPGMDEETREAICGAAVRAAKAVDYVGAGTVEFIADASDGLSTDRIFFMEMNTRLQVEHPVTEEITGVDLVEWQLRVASGEQLPLRQDKITMNGHAIEARLYAEDPAKGFLPSTGVFRNSRGWFEVARIETGVENGDIVSPFYDPMIAKLVAHGDNRIEAIELIWEACTDVEIYPLKTNAGFLARILDLSDFQSGQIDTGLIARHGDALTAQGLPEWILLAAVSWRLEEFIVAAHEHDLAISPTGLMGIRLNREAAPIRLTLTVNGVDIELEINRVGLGGDWQWRVVADGKELGELAFDLPTTHGPSAETQPDGTIWLFDRGFAYEASFGPKRPRAGSTIADGVILAPMPGKVIALDVAEGDTVAEGQRLMVLEAMKMEHALTAPFAGTVRELAVTTGAQVEVEQQLARVERADD